MSNRGTPFRALLTVLLAVTLPLCCCNFHGWVLSHLSCETSRGVIESLADTRQEDGGEPSPAQDQTPHCVTACCSSPGPTGGEASEGLSAELHHCRDQGDRHECACGKNSVKMLAASPTTLDLQAPVVIAIIAWQPATGAPAGHSLQAKGMDPRAHERPPPSLVHMHCALNV